MSLVSDRFAQQQKAVVPFNRVEDFPPTVLDQLARLKPGMPIVAVLYTGGTIGTELQERIGHQVLIPSETGESLLNPLREKGISKMAQIIWVPIKTPMWDRLDKAMKLKPMDSTNGRWTHWASIGHAIRRLYDLVDGFVIAHGTDTMAFTAAALKWMLPNSGKPMVCTGSQKSMVMLGDDGTNNLYRAIVAAASDLSGPFLVFGDELMIGTHVTKVQDRRFTAFQSPQRFIVGHFDSDGLETYSHAPRRASYVTGERLEFDPLFRDGVKIEPLSPATPSESILHDANDPLCRVMLMVTYGAGNVRDEGIVEMEQTHIDCLATLYERRYPVVLGTPMDDGEVKSPYPGGVLAVAREPGGGYAISGGCTSGALLHVKMMRALAKTWDDAKDGPDYDRFLDFMSTNHVGELSKSI